MTETADLPFASADTVRELSGWLSQLGAERRMSPKTVEAYRRDVLQFLAFLSQHLGGAVSLGALDKLKPADVRAFMAARRANGIGSRSLMRSLAGTRSFATYLERAGKGKVGALQRRACAKNREIVAKATAAPRPRRNLPMPTSAPANRASRGFWRAMPP